MLEPKTGPSYAEAARCTSTELSYDQREEIISRLQHVRITDWMPDGDCPGHIRKVTAADMLDCVLESLREFRIAPSSKAVDSETIREAVNRLNSLANYGKPLSKPLKAEVIAVADLLTPLVTRSAIRESEK